MCVYVCVRARVCQCVLAIVSGVYKCVRAYECVCVRVHALRIDTKDKILRVINILINIIITLSPVNHIGLLYKG